MEGKRILLWNVINDTLEVVRKKRPSDLLPFKGKFPLINDGQYPLFRIGCEGKTYLDECDNWIQQALIKAQRIVDIENGFYQYLKNNGIEVTYYSMNGKQKADEIKRFFNSTCLDVEDLVIKDSEYGKL